MRFLKFINDVAIQVILQCIFVDLCSNALRQHVDFNSALRQVDITADREFSTFGYHCAFWRGNHRGLELSVLMRQDSRVLVSVKHSAFWGSRRNWDRRHNCRTWNIEDMR